jgi:hypothetical protein
MRTATISLLVLVVVVAATQTAAQPNSAPTRVAKSTTARPDAATPSNPDALFTRTIDISFPLCEEYVTYDEMTQCSDKNYVIDRAAKKFTLGVELWRNELYDRLGVDRSLIPYYQLTVTGKQFGYFRKTDNSVVPVRDALAMTACDNSNRYGNELLFVMNANTTITAVPIRGRSVLPLKSFPTPVTRCGVFTSHAGLAFGAKYYADPFTLPQDMKAAFSGGKTAVSIYTAGTIDYNSDWSAAVNVTSCSGHFKPNIISFVNFLYYMNDHYGSLQLLTADEEKKLWADAMFYLGQLGSGSTAGEVTAKFKSKLRVKPMSDMQDRNASTWCFAYPIS